MDLTGKVAIITGASAGIGRRVALDLAKAGAAVGLIARREDRLAALAEEIRAAGGRAAYASADVANAEAVRAAAQALREALGPVDILVNNAGYGKRMTFAETTVEDITGMMQVNYLGTVYGMKAVLPEMLERRSGHIINVASIAGELPSPTFGPYNASKHAVVALSTAVTPELAVAGVRLSMVNPGPVATEFFDDPSWEGKRPHGSLPMATVEQCSAAVFECLRTGKPLVHVPKWQGWVAWLYKVTGPLGRAITARVRW